MSEPMPIHRQPEPVDAVTMCLLEVKRHNVSLSVTANTVVDQLDVMNVCAHLQGKS